MDSIIKRLAQEVSAHHYQVAAAVKLLDEGSTVPFIARYRKEATGGLDDARLRLLEERLSYLRELDQRREAILKSIDEQGLLTPDLEGSIRSAETKVRLEDLYLPFRPKRRTKAQMAREAGLAPLAEALLGDPKLQPFEEALAFVDDEKGVTDAAAALEGARHILIEDFSEDANLMGELREKVWETASLRSKVVKTRQDRGAKFSDYFDFVEPLSTLPSHRVLALFRGRREGVLRLSLEFPESKTGSIEASFLWRVALHFGISEKGRPGDGWLRDTVEDAWTNKIRPKLQSEAEARLGEAADAEAIRVFGANVRDLLMMAPAGERVTMGLDPGFRSGVKVAVVDGTGKMLSTETIYPHPPQSRPIEALKTLAELCRRHSVELIAIGNGTASRETDRLVGQLIADHPDLGLSKLVVSEAGASVYSASEIAGEEFPDLDVTLRGAVSIARRVQDPLAELVKIDPRSIGVGQYQHDVSETALARRLDGIVEDCVNAVGVDVNTASAPLLMRVSGLNAAVARHIVDYRDHNGPFGDRKQLGDVPRLGARTFELAAGFLRIRGGDNPLDASAVHPEAYPVVQRIVQVTGKSVRDLIGNAVLLGRLQPNDFVDERFGEPTVRDILGELEKPGRDPRPEFRTARFKEGVENIEDLKPGMVLEGTVSNVTNFGAFVDIGVHQDGLVHISQLSDRYVKDPRQVVKAGDVVRVRVLEVDANRRRIALSMRRGQSAQAHRPSRRPAPTSESAQGRGRTGTSMGDAFRRLKGEPSDGGHKR